MKRKLRRIKRKLKRSNIVLKILSLIIIVLIVVFYILGESIIKDKNDYEKLLEESNKLHKYLTIENLNEKYIQEIEAEKICKSKETILIEEALEEFSRDYYNQLDKTIKSIKDEKYTNILTASNYATDGPAFTNSLNYITEKNKEIDTLKLDLERISSKIYYTKYIKERTKDYKSIDRYNNLVNKIINKKDIELLNNDLNNLKEILKVSNDIFIYLGRTNTEWHIENNEIIFTNLEVKTEYEKAINKIKR